MTSSAGGVALFSGFGTPYQAITWFSLIFNQNIHGETEVKF